MVLTRRVRSAALVCASFLATAQNSARTWVHKVRPSAGCAFDTMIRVGILECLFGQRCRNRAAHDRANENECSHARMNAGERPAVRAEELPWKASRARTTMKRPGEGSSGCASTSARRFFLCCKFVLQRCLGVRVVAVGLSRSFHCARRWIGLHLDIIGWGNRFCRPCHEARAQRRPKQYRLSALIWSRKRKAAQAFGPGGFA